MGAGSCGREDAFSPYLRLVQHTRADLQCDETVNSNYQKIHEYAHLPQIRYPLNIGALFMIHESQSAFLVEKENVSLTYGPRVIYLRIA